MALIISPAASATVLYTNNAPINEVAWAVVSKAGTVTGTAGVGSSLFLQRLYIPGPMNLSEVQCAMSIGFPATNQGAGTMSRSLALYSFGNSTSLASVFSTSATSAWSTGTSTTAGAVSLTQFQGGWSVPLIQPMTFAATGVVPGEYVIGNLFNFAQASSTWTINFYGPVHASLTSATLGALSSGGLAAVSAHTGTTGTAVTVWTGAPNTMLFGKLASTASVTAAAASSLMATATANSTATFLMGGVTGAVGLLTSLGFSAGSFVGTSGSLSAVTAVGTSIPNFGFIGTNSTTSGFPTTFVAGIMSTGAIPTAITVTSAAVTYSGSAAFQQPWFALAGS